MQTPGARTHAQQFKYQHYSTLSLSINRWHWVSKWQKHGSFEMLISENSNRRNPSRAHSHRHFIHSLCITTDGLTHMLIREDALGRPNWNPRPQRRLHGLCNSCPRRFTDSILFLETSLLHLVVRRPYMRVISLQQPRILVTKTHSTWPETITSMQTEATKRHSPMSCKNKQ